MEHIIKGIFYLVSGGVVDPHKCWVNHIVCVCVCVWCFKIGLGPQPIVGGLATSPVLLTQTRTRLQRKSLVTGVPTSKTTALTFGFSLSIMAFATNPPTPTSCGHDLFPVHHAQHTSSSFSFSPNFQLLFILI